MTMGEKILKLRKARLWNQEELAEHIGVTRQAVSRWESESAKPDAEKIVALCDLFGVSADYLLREQYIGDGPAVREPSPLPEQPSSQESKKPRTSLSGKQFLGFGLFALGLLLLFAMELVGILQPHTLHTDHGVYHGFQAYVRLYDLQWMLWILGIMIGGGVVLMLWDGIVNLFRKYINMQGQ